MSAHQLITGHDFLNLPMEDNDSGASTVRGYLVALLANVWQEGEGFSGKRPFGNSGWHYDLYQPLMAAGYVETETDSWGDTTPKDYAEADALIRKAIDALGNPPMKVTFTAKDLDPSELTDQIIAEMNNRIARS